MQGGLRHSPPSPNKLPSSYLLSMHTAIQQGKHVCSGVQSSGLQLEAKANNPINQ